MPKKRVIHWVCSHPTPYNEFLFNTLASAPDFDLRVQYITRVTPTYPWRNVLRYSFNAVVHSRRFGVGWDLFRNVRRDGAELVVVSCWNDPNVAALLAGLTVCGTPFALWTDTPVLNRRRSAPKRILRNMYLGALFEGAKWVLGTGTPAMTTLKAMGCPAEKLVNLPFFVDLALYACGDRSVIPGRSIRFLSAGRLHNTVKGTDIALQALARAWHLTGIDDFEYSIAGVGPDEGELRALVQKLGLSSKVRFCGWVEADALAEMYRSHDVLLHPALVDPFPVAVLEAMAAGLVVLGSDACGSVVDRITHGENGLIHSAGNAEQLASQIAALLLHSEQITSMSVAARRTSETWPASHAIQIVRHVLTDHRDPRGLRLGTGRP